jgi:hypothetical protein
MDRHEHAGKASFSSIVIEKISLANKGVFGYGYSG